MATEVSPEKPKKKPKKSKEHLGKAKKHPYPKTLTNRTGPHKEYGGGPGRGFGGRAVFIISVAVVACHCFYHIKTNPRTAKITTMTTPVFAIRAPYDYCGKHMFSL